MADESLRVSRLADRVESASGERDVYVWREGNHCGVPDEPFLAQLTDVVQSPSLGTAKVYGFVARCQKDWLDEVEFVTHDCGSGNTVTLSKEVKFRGNKFEDCAPYGEPCPEATLIYNYATGRWEGELPLLEGTASLAFYCTWDGFVKWWLEVAGCAYPAAVLLTPTCVYPPKWTGTGNEIFGDCCPEGLLMVPTVYTIEALVDPLYEGRLADHVNGMDVYAYDEHCEASCQESAGCCPGVPLDSQWEFTIFNVSGCGCGAAVDGGYTFGNVCQTFGLSGCSTAFTLCLLCQPYGNERTWEHYRLQIGTGGKIYTPSSGSCDPVSVTFHGVEVIQDVGPYGTCVGTISVTVTRP